MKETNILRQIQLNTPPNCRLFRNNTGMAWQGREVKINGERYIKPKAAPVHFGLCKGSSDLIGWTSVVITPEMVGQTVAIFTAIEGKTAKGNATEQQQKFIQVVIKAGGIAGIARSPEDANNLIPKQ